MYRQLSILPIGRLAPAEAPADMNGVVVLEYRERDGLLNKRAKTIKGFVCNSQYLKLYSVASNLWSICRMGVKCIFRLNPANSQL